MPVFSVSASALVEVDGYNAYLAWWVDNPADYVSFTNQIITNISSDFLTVQVDIDLITVIPKKSTFDIDLQFSFSQVGSISVTKLQPMNSTNVPLDDIVTEINNGRIYVPNLQYKEDVKYIRVQFNIYSPTWVVAADESNMIISGKQYTYQKGTTWGEWVNSSYDTLGLYEDNGGIYGANVKLTYNGNLVKSTDYILSGGVYKLEPLESVATTIDFKVTFNGGKDNGTTKTYKADYGMTWAQWVASSYNVDGFSTYSISNTIKDKSGRFIYKNSIGTDLVFTNDVIIEGYNYYARGVATYASRGYNTYTFNFSIDKAEVTVQDEKGILNGILSWLKDIGNGVKELPSKVGDAIANKIKGLFVPSEDKLIEILDKFEQLLDDRFGIVYDAGSIVEDFATAFSYTEGKSTLTFPSVTVNLSGTQFTFGGWEVSIVPDRFEGIIASLKFITNIACTYLCINAIKRRGEGVVR